MNATAFLVLAMAAALGACCARAGEADAKPAFRPPAVPLVTYNPFLSIWCETDKLTDDVTRHWTRHPHSLISLIRIDGKTYRLMGNAPKSGPKGVTKDAVDVYKDIPAFPQVSVHVFPTRSFYDFNDGHLHVTLDFMTPLLPDDLDVLARPVTYLTWQVVSVDGAPHDVALYDSTSSQLAVNKTEEKVVWARETAGDLTALRVGTVEQPILGSCGDDHRINWGYAYAAARSKDAKAAIGSEAACVKAFVEQGGLPAQDDTRMPRAANDEQPVMAFAFHLGKVAGGPGELAMRQVLVAYDEIYAIKYFGKRLRPYWRRNGASMADVLQAAARDYEKLYRRCDVFDTDFMADLTKAGGARYVQICALAYRQTWAACGLAADANKQPHLFTKENTSNGDIATVDVFYPMDPLQILVSPTLAKASLVAVLQYSASPRWKFPNAPHDLGTYPLVFGRDDGGEGMPVEESGNMILLCDAIAQAEGNADFVTPWWPQLTQWAQYLEKYGLDPENQLCTDDFMGHLAHNANLSVKAILGLAAYGDLCKMRGDAQNADKYSKMAKVDAEHWMQVAAEGDHYRLAFDKPNTWSQKYNLVWDRILGLNVFPPAVAQKEVAHYKKVMLKYGVPLDSRTHLTKTDWSIWSATLADNQADFEALVSPIYDYLNETTARDPLADSYTTDQVGSGGMHARPVVGGVFIKMLADRALWKKWASRDHEKVGDWAPMPEPPEIKEIVPASKNSPIQWRYTIEKPADDWTKPEFNATAWKEGPGGFGTQGTPGAVVRTVWKTADIWIRREFTMPEGAYPNLQFYVHHDEDVEIYVNGVRAATANAFTSSYEPLEMSQAALALLKPGAKITLAAHCHQTEGGQYIDVGLANVVER